MWGPFLTALPLLVGLCAQPPGFNADIRPILSDNCFKCHGFDAAQRKAGLRLDERDSAVVEKGVIVPGDAASSALVKRITSDDPDFRMPPPDSNLTLTDAEIQKIISWIDDGTDYEPHWSFIPPKKVAVPELEDPEGWQRNGIDAFILNRLLAEGLEPSPEASREALLRRVSFDLTGLPPTLDEIDAFLEDTGPEAYERAVERLLASPAYGERMAMVWLDLARYADTFGYQNDRENHVWPWRDWVIRAFNENLSYDDFIIWQLAGDLLPNATQDQILATAFNRLHRQTNEGGSVLEEFRVEYVADRVKTVGTAFLGLTMECARCHDHKFDPITQREYYAMGAFFSNIDESGMYSHYTNATPTPSLVLLTEAEREEHEGLKNEIDVLETDLRTLHQSKKDLGLALKWAVESGTSVSAPEANVRATFDDASDETTPVTGIEINEVKAILKWDPEFMESPRGRAVAFSGDNGVAIEEAGTFDLYESFSIALRVWLPEGVNRGVIAHKSRAAEDAANRGYELVYENGKLQFSLCHFWPGNAIRVETAEAMPVNEWLRVAVMYDGSSKASGVRFYVNGEVEPISIIRDNLTKTILYKPDEWVPLILGYRDRDSGFKGGRIDEIAVYDRALTLLELRAEFSGMPVPPAAYMEGAVEHYYARVDEECMAVQRALDKARNAEAAFIEPKREIMVMREMAEPRPDYVLARGEYDKRGDYVGPDTPQAVMPFPGFWKNRLGLAQWMTARSNPLTARVAVNLFWQTIFGKGIVESQEDFGSQGKLPTHPQLLDYLAVWFQENEWDVKALIKLLVTSATYRQDSEASPELLERDPYNVLLARGPSHRLLAEEIRDAALAASGLLVREIGGPSVKPYQPGSLWQEASSIDYIPDTGDGLYRRSMYTFWKRTVPPPSMLTFDAPDRESCVARRERTSTPLQSLVLLNGVQFVEAARVLAADVLENKADAPHEERLVTVVRRLLGRFPAEAELDILNQVYQSHRELYGAEPEAAAAYVEAGDYQVDPALDKVELAALTAVAQLIMNFDEFVMKR